LLFINNIIHKVFWTFTIVVTVMSEILCYLDWEYLPFIAAAVPLIVVISPARLQYFHYELCFRVITNTHFLYVTANSAVVDRFCTCCSTSTSVSVGNNSSWLKLLVIDGQGLTIACSIATLFFTTTTSRMVLRPTHPLTWMA